MVSTKQRIEYIDIAKALGVLLVLAGHTGLPLLFRSWIYSFHMPLFFFVSGIWFRKRAWKDSLIRGIGSYLIPYIGYSITFLCLNGVLYRDLTLLKENLHDTLVGKGSCNVLWFLWSLFVVEMSYRLLAEVVHKKMLPVVSFLLCLIAWGARQCGLPNAGFLLSSLEALFFFSMGNVFFAEKAAAFTATFQKAMIFLLANLLLFAGSWMFYPRRLDISDAVLGLFPCSIITAVAGIMMILCISALMIEYEAVPLIQWIKPLLSYIGRHTLFFFPLTSYLPGFWEKILLDIGVQPSLLLDVSLKGLAFLFAAGMVEGGKIRKEQKKRNLS